MEKTIITTSSIPYEIRRNPLEISLFKHAMIKNHKLVIGAGHKINKDLEPFVIRDNLSKVSVSTPYVYVYRTMSLDNYGHFIVDNLIPLYKMIVLTQGYNFKREDVLFCFLKAPAETVIQQTISEKQRSLLSAFSSHPIRFIEEIEDMPIANLVVPFLGLGQSIAFMKWHKYAKYNEAESIHFIRQFRERIYTFFEIRLSNPYKEIFLSRAGAKHRKVLNEEEVVQELRLEPIVFQNKTIKEELQLFADSRLVVTPYGAGVVGCYFMQPGSKCIIVHPRGFDDKYDFPQIYIRLMKRLGIHVMAFHNPLGLPSRNIFKNRDSNITIAIEDLKNSLS